MNVVTVKTKGENSSINNIKTSKKDSLQRRKQTDGVSNRWAGAIHVKHMSKEN